MVTLRRYVVLIGLMFWQGGFIFYASVVVPIGTEVLGSPLKQGFITRQVTGWLNVSAAVVLAILAGEMLLGRDAERWRRGTAWACWVGMSACQVVLFRLHSYLDSLMQVRGRIVLDPEAFGYWHRVYLWTHTVQWAFGLVFVALMLMAWRREDATPAGSSGR
jgi:hypothetical protein